MKKLILFLFVLLGLNGFAQHSIPVGTVTPTQLTAGNGTVVVKSGTTTISGPVNVGTIVAVNVGTIVAVNAATVAAHTVSITNTPTNVNTTSTVAVLPTVNVGTIVAVNVGTITPINVGTITAVSVLNNTQDSIYKRVKTVNTQLDSIRLGNLPRIRVREDSLQNALTRIQNQEIANGIKLDSIKANTQSSELYLKAINEGTLTGLGVSSQITYTTAFVTKASAGIFYGCFGYNSKTSGQWILFFNSTTIPADATATFIASVYVPAQSGFSFSTGLNGIPFSTGIVWSNSSTPQTKTIGSSDVQITMITK